MDDGTDEATRERTPSSLDASGDPRRAGGGRRAAWAHVATAAVAGLLAGAVAVAAAELAAGLIGVTSIVASVGEAVIEFTPPALSEFVIDRLGGLNRSVLVVGTLALLTLLSLVIGLLTLRHVAYGVAGIAALGAVGTAASVANPVDPLPAALVPGVVATAAGVAALWIVRPGRWIPEQPDPDRPSAPAVDRRAFLRAAASLSVLAAVAAAGGRWLQRLGRPAVERRELALPAADAPADPLPSGADFDLAGLSRFTTPNRDFYRIDTALFPPAVRADEWQLRIHGMIDREMTLTYDDLLARDLVEADITLTCVSNEVGGELIGNARWLGVRLDTILEEVGIREEADQLVGRSVDGYTGGFPVADALDGRDALIAIGMNGEPLPLEHGYPARLVVPGLYGYVSAVKWLSELELTTFAAFDQYWVQRGWAEEAPIKTQSRIDRPRDGARVEAGEFVVAGVAWAQTRGISQVEVQIGDGDWIVTEIAQVPGGDTWRQWLHVADLPPGEQRVRVRATDGDGVTQPGEPSGPRPEGAEGWHTIHVTAQ
jgi:DMSO/TMAO reductase YedYZ molybdopterin-dependent catalytic subunit